MRELLRTARSNRNMTQEQVAAEIPCSAAYYSDIETGKKNPSLKVANRIEDILGVRVLPLNILQTTGATAPKEFHTPQG